VTAEELRRYLKDIEIANGLGNRFLFVCVRRQKLLPSGGNLDSELVADLAELTRDRLDSVRCVGRMRRTSEADALWKDLYQALNEHDDYGLVGSITARDAAHVLRLSVLYAAMDASSVIEGPHLQAAWTLWSYCERSARWIFQEQTGDDVADRLLDAVRAAHASGGAGLDGTQQFNLFSRHVSHARLAEARQSLETRGLVETVYQETGGRPKLVTFLRANKANKAN
jgi:hypothetical protein